MSIIINNIPAELRELPQWLLWRREIRDDKPTKIPYQPCGLKRAKSNDPHTWCNFDEAIAALPKFDGIGFVFTANDPYVGIDLDHCVDPSTGIVMPWTSEQKSCESWGAMVPDPESIIAAIESYSEFSPSGTGIHIIVKGQLPKGLKRGHFEAYKIGRYFSVTGKQVPGTASDIRDYSLTYLCSLFDSNSAAPKHQRKPRQPAPSSQSLPSIDQIIAKIRTASNSAAFDRLFAGQWQDEYPSQSEADAALCGIAVFYTNGDAATLDAIFRQSKLYREKWDEIRGDRTYGEMTIDGAIAGCSKFYEWSSGGRTSPKAYSLGAASFVVKSSSHTPKKTTVTIELIVNSKPVDVVTFTTAASNRAAACKTIKQRCFFGDDPTTIQQIDSLLGTILVDASRPQERQKQEGKMIHEIIAEYVPELVQLVFRTDSGKAYSRTSKSEMSRSQFLGLCVNSGVIAKASVGLDAPLLEDGSPNRTSLVSLLKVELEILWGDLFSQLPLMDKAELTDDDEPVRQMRQYIIDVWTRPNSMKLNSHKLNGGHTAQIASRTCLAAEARKMQDSPTEFSDKWHQIHDAYQAFYREYAGPATKGEVVSFLGMRYELFSQVGVTVKGFTKHTFRSLAVTHQCASDPNANSLVTARMTGGSKMVVLSKAMTDRILSRPFESQEKPSSDQSNSVTESPEQLFSDGVTE